MEANARNVFCAVARFDPSDEPVSRNPSERRSKTSPAPDAPRAPSAAPSAGTPMPPPAVLRPFPSKPPRRSRRRPRYSLWTAAAFAVVALGGCAPRFVVHAETIVAADQTVERRVAVGLAADAPHNGGTVRIADFLAFSPAGRYREFALQDRRLMLRGAFARFEDILPDVRVKLPGFAREAKNEFHRRHADFRLFALVDYEERMGDLADRADGEAALAELLRWVVPDVASAVRERYGADYDLTEFERFLHVDVPGMVGRLYSGLWEMRRAKRSGLTGLTESAEAFARVSAEARAQGLELLAPDAGPEAAVQAENSARARQWAARRLQALARPRTAQTPPLSADAWEDKALREALTRRLTERHGSFKAAMERTGALLPRAFGAFLMPRVMPVGWYARYQFQMRLVVPGRVLQTNGLCDMDGSVYWTFAGEDAALAGQSMWARTLVVDPAAAEALGLRDFPGNLAVVERLARLMSGPGGSPRLAVVRALEASVGARSLAPLAALADSGPAADPGDALSARQVHGVLTRLRTEGERVEDAVQ